MSPEQNKISNELKLLTSHYHFRLFLAAVLAILLLSYLLAYPSTSSKLYIVQRSITSGLAGEYGIWGQLTDYLILAGKFFTKGKHDSLIAQAAIYVQLSLIWGSIIYVLLKNYGFYSILPFFLPLNLNYFALATRDAICFGVLILALLVKNTGVFLIISLAAVVTIHKGLIPLFLGILCIRFSLLSG